MKLYGNYMQRAIELAQRGVNTTTPNPNVGCVIVKDGHIIGEGFHQQAGQPHAEINALTHAVENGHSPRGATAYVTLEPCSHYGKTPPCADALIEAGIAEVFIGSRDPNPQVSGRGVEKLRNVGIKVHEDILREQCDELNLGFFKRMTTGLPWVTVKLGMTLDAKIATASGESQWITGTEARQDVQHVRAKSCAVMTSSATVIADNPSLNVRLPHVSRQPKRVIVDSHLSVSPSAKIFTLDGEVLVYTCSDIVPPPSGGRLGGGRVSAPSNTLNNSVDGEPLPHPNPPPLGEGVYIHVPEKNHHADVAAVLKDLGENQHCNNVLVEAGGRFAGALLAENLVDELVIYTAPTLLGEGARPAFNFPAASALVDAKHFFVHDHQVIGNDIKTVFRKKP